ncbi:hypothetical protein ASZ90_010174 [hydrocarbon metagenome]|uniref:Uncharacterized protein n=1 Tax=hydrocarbon metagenome TaxID=938273 RepID=A0A0W8FH64_9ZZZZ
MQFADALNATPVPHRIILPEGISPVPALFMPSDIRIASAGGREARGNKYAL